MRPLVTILTTVKDGESTIIQTIDSVLNQSYKKFEYIIIDDGSVDETHSILENYERKDKRIKIYKTGGIGRAEALNKGINVSKGKYIAIIDADDLFHPSKIEIQVSFLSKHSNCFLVGTKTEIFYNDGGLIWPAIEEEYKTELINSKILIRNSINHSSVMMNQQYLKEIGMYNINRKTQVDYDLWLRAYNNKLISVNIDLPLTAKRIHANQSYENKRRFKYISNATKLQLTNILSNKNHWYYFPFPIINFWLSFLPFKVRRKIVSLIEF